MPFLPAEVHGKEVLVLAVCYVGAEDRLFHPGWQPERPFRALFVGKLIPLHGLETIVDAAAPSEWPINTRERPGHSRSANWSAATTSLRIPRVLGIGESSPTQMPP